jgi:hypothetical protein
MLHGFAGSCCMNRGFLAIQPGETAGANKADTTTLTAEKQVRNTAYVKICQHYSSDSSF